MKLKSKTKIKPKLKPKQKEPKKIKSNSYLIYLILIFLVIQIIGLVVASYYSRTDAIKGVLTDDPNDIINALFIIGEILVFTGVVLLLKRFFKSGNYLYVFEFLALFVGIVVVLDVFVSYLLAIIISFVLLVIKRYMKDKVKFKKLLMWYNNILLGLAIAGAGAIIGLSLGLIPIIVFLVLLSIYDIIAVFYTKHMVVLAKMFIKKKIALTFSIPSKERVFQLGGGDIVIPLTLSASYFFILIKSFSFWVSIIPIILIWISSLLGLIWTFWILRTGKAKVMPALPAQTLLMLVVVIVSYIILF